MSTGGPSLRDVFAPGRRMLAIGLVLIITIVASESLAIGTVMPLVERDLGQLALYGWVFSGFFLGNLVGITLAGRAADRVPLLVPFAAGIGLFAAGLVAGGLAGSMPILVAARVLQGLGAGALPATAYVVIGRAFPSELRPRMFALLSTAWVVPSVVAPSLASLVGERLSWRWVFLGLLPFLLPCALVALVAVSRVAGPEPGGESGGAGHTVRDAVLIAAGVGLLLVGLGQARLVLLVGVSAVGALVAVPAFRRLTPEGTLRARPGLPAAIATRGALTFAFFSSDAYVPLGLVNGRGTSTLFAGVAITAVTVAWTTGSWVQARTIDRVGPRGLVVRGAALMGAGIMGFAIVLGTQAPVAFAIPLAFVIGLGIGQAYSPLSVTVLAEAPAESVGRASAALQLSDVSGVALGTGLAGVVVAAADRAGWSTQHAVVVVFLGSALAALAVVAIARRLPRTVSEATAMRATTPTH